MATVERGLEVRTSKYWPHPPSEPQFVFLSLPHEEALYGGAAGGGKSDALLMAALQYVDVPGYAAIIIRRSFTQLTQPDALIPRSHEWLAGTDARWNEQLHEWKFPSGALLKFGYLDSRRDLDNYQGAAYQFIGWDELTQFELEYYTYVSFSRNRRRADVQVPIRIRGASNPGGRSHDAVRDRFGLYRPEGDPAGTPLMCQRPGWEHFGKRIFIPAKVRDNPGLDVADYIQRMAANLDHHTRAQLLDGDWDSRPPGDLFRREWFDIVDQAPGSIRRWVRFWDMAATEPSERNPDPDWTVGLRLGHDDDGNWYVTDIRRLRGTPNAVREAIQQAAKEDGTSVPIRMEQEPGSSGKTVIDAYVRDYLAGYNVKGKPSTGKKFARAQPVSSKAEHGLVKLVRASWNNAFLSECEDFSEDPRQYAHDDQVDGLSGAFEELSGAPGPPRSKESHPWR